MNGTEPRGCSLESGVSRPSRVCTAVGAFVLLLAAAARWSGAWAGARITDPDAGVVALMARHMAEGRDFPTFFYGQAYMGSLEPAVSALFCRLLGVSGFAVNLGTAFFGWLLIPVLWRWGRAIGGFWGGLVAALLCAIGPREFAWFMVVPRGGYAAATLLQTLLLAGAASASVRFRKNEYVSTTFAIGLGLAAGLAWWCHPITTSALVTATVLLAIGMRGRILNRFVLWAAAGFFLGSAPFWIWNLRNGWASLRMMKGVGSIRFVEGLYYLPLRWARLAGGGEGPPSLFVLTHLALYGLLAAAGVIALIVWFLRTRKWDAMVATGVAVSLHSVFALLLYTHSVFIIMHTARYLVPLMPSLAILTAVAAGAGRQRRAVPLAIAGLAIAAAALQSSYFGEVARRRERHLYLRQTDVHLAKVLEDMKAEAVYAHFHYHPFNFALGERWVFTEGRAERVPGYAERAETADRIAFLGNRFGAESFTTLAGGRSRRMEADGIRIAADFEPPHVALEEIPPTRWSRITDMDGNDLSHRLADRDADTGWAVAGVPFEETGFEIHFADPERPAMLRLCLSFLDFGHCEASVEQLDPRDGRWHIVHSRQHLPQLHWSGPRPFPMGRRFRIEYALPEEPAAALRWRVRPWPHHEGHASGRMFEAQVFSKVERHVPREDEAIADLVNALKKTGVRRAYADRWISNALAARAGDVEVERDIPPGASDALGAEGRLHWMPGTGIVARDHDAPQIRSALDAAGLRFTEAAVPPWRLFVAAPPKFDSCPPLFWTGYTLFKGQIIANWRHHLDRLIAGLETPQGASEAVQWLEDLCRRRPDLLSAAGPLVIRLREAFSDRLPGEIEREWRAQSVPPIPLPAVFEDGLALVGIGVTPASVPPGGRVQIRFFWRFSPDYPFAGKIVFVHFQAGPLRFQDDHGFPNHWRYEIPHVPRGVVYHEERVVHVPPNAPDGPVRLVIGVYDTATRRRDRVQSSLQTSRRALMYDGVFCITSGAREPATMKNSKENP